MIDALRRARSRFLLDWKIRENLDFIIKIEQIVACNGLQIKDLRDQFPRLANRELNRSNREAQSA
jgi:hypothetical protein